MRAQAKDAAEVSKEETSSTPMKESQQHNFTLSFPPLLELQDIRRGDFVTSSTLQVPCGDRRYEFRVLLYPRGGGHNSAQQGDAVEDRVGVYLQFLPQHDNDTVDATFGLRLKGRQSQGPRFDVEWKSGVRFVPLDKANLKDGTANDFGSHMMQSHLLEDFLGGEDSEESLDVEVTVKIHPASESSLSLATGSSLENEKPSSNFGFFRDIREIEDCGGGGEGSLQQHNPENVRVGKIIVPILQRLSQRPRMFELGAYPGVEYRIMRILHPETGEDIFTSMHGADYELKPIYPLVAALERNWPVRVNEKELPKIYTMTMFNVISALGSLFTAVAGLTTAFIISQLVSIFFIPSKSMDPTLQVGDVLLVEKVTPRVFNSNPPNEGDVVLFNPNDKLQAIVKANGGRISDRDLFVKRVAAGPGDYVSVESTGSVSVNGVAAKGRRDLCEEEPLKLIERYVQPVDKQDIKKDQVFVLGDCSSVSVDSRVWGPVNKNEIVGKPLFRIWPVERWGPIPRIPTNDDAGSIPIEASATGSLVTEWTER
ncbi:Thylakoidal processing peptidase [Seminavis robusta]|uniref:Mitochondrial inner membrane protease subunit n=1 Tax=Seminavis robusta TaxID=568900 RepID=A0A9N8DDY5_9STRA|nr:Thylakoidal processing peptidase [Seminavis robusta]|eukprot:Sro110_g054950.1 Thylakoidal processing peptidase (540) ;mRNA; f:73407-75026